MPRKPIESGRVINGFTIIEFVKSEHYIIKCHACGEEKQMRLNSIKKSKSCGCKKRGKYHHSYKHGLDLKSSIYYMWHDMKNRCYNPNSDRYNCYGQRGIKVCSEWKNNYKRFHDWVIMNGWRDGLQIDRINVDDNYNPSNCRFVTKKKIQETNKILFG